MRIGVLTTSFPRHRDDYAGAFVLGCARALAARGHTLDVLAPEPQLSGQPPRFRGIEVTWLPYAWPRIWQQTFYGAGVPENLAQRPWLAPGLMGYTARLLAAAAQRVRQWDAVISHWALPCGLVGAAVAGRRPHLAFCHSADVHALTTTRLARPLRRWLCAQGTRFWFVSERHRAAFVGDLGPRAQTAAHVGSMGIEPGGRPEPRAACRRRWDMDRFTVLALGRLVPIKGLEDAVSAVARVPNAELILAGDGPQLDALARRASQCGVRLRAAGIVTGRDKAQLLHAADALVVPSRTTRTGRCEGLPTVITEAQAAGLPVVATRTGGIPSTLTDQVDALLVEPRRPDQLAEALIRLQHDATLRQRLAEAGTCRARGLTWPALAPTVERLLSGTA